MSRILEPAEVDRQLSELPSWSSDGTSLHRSIDFPSFPEAIAAVASLAIDAEEMNHHPDIDIRWRTVNLTLSTHSAGGITQLDIELAHRIETHAP
ncbi:MAG: 4a-hydroxytetrahydrobiopterin dehydratase [Actinomycetia bacterium]|nr:4a-hydroxytetrahydrobiopterin dehydratase [Actinomycetes bacterium]